MEELKMNATSENFSNNAVEGFFGLHKPVGISSQRAVQIVKFWARDRTGNKKIKVGHGGTLDPLASGVLVIAIGRSFTKQIDVHVAAEKEYEAEITLGQTSMTDDAEGEKKVHHVASQPSRTDVESILLTFVGEIEQIPPAYSAIKIDGKEAYKRVRGGEDVVMQKRTVFIKEIALIEYAYPMIRIRVVCGKGTYIRSLARDIGQKLGTGGYMSALVRTRVGDFRLAQCKTVEDFMID